MSEREEKFERMLEDVERNYFDTAAKMEQFKADGKENSATFRQYMGNKLMYQNILSLYRVYGLID